MATIGIYRFAEGRRIDADDVAFLDLLVPHMKQAYEIHRELQSHRNQWTATTEVLDRIPIGVMLIGADGKVSALNQMAERIVARDDGLALDDGHPHLASSPDADARLRDQLGRAVDGRLEPGKDEEGIAVPRPSGLHDFALLVTSLIKLRAQDPGMGVRDSDALDQLASAGGLVREAMHVMPANDHVLVWQRRC